jgi:hypothetical protein
MLEDAVYIDDFLNERIGGRGRGPGLGRIELPPDEYDRFCYIAASSNAHGNGHDRCCNGHCNSTKRMLAAWYSSWKVKRVSY